MSALNLPPERTGTENVWSIPVVEKGERFLEVSFEIKGDGEVDAEVLESIPWCNIRRRSRG